MPDVLKETLSNLSKGRILSSNMRCLESAEVTCYRGNDLRPAKGIAVKNVEKSMVRIQGINDLSKHNRHVDQIQFQEPDHTGSTSNTRSDRHKKNLRTRHTISYRHLDSNLSCGGCGVCIN
ncbi:unnamed protein product [Schistosoma mattheei]|uniref:Uncharacterized protein n=1 Tax=Schistosoma mattheei TaxID=31246 RepID=A0A183PGN1_9TREM|nr:unnamed protein product [Schistosoma mattheei]